MKHNNNNYCDIPRSDIVHNSPNPSVLALPWFLVYKKEMNTNEAMNVIFMYLFTTCVDNPFFCTIKYSNCKQPINNQILLLFE